MHAIAHHLVLLSPVARPADALARSGLARSYLYPPVDGVACYAARQTSILRGSQDPGADGDKTSQRHVESLIADAQAARVKARIRVMLSRLLLHLKSSSKAVA